MKNYFVKAALGFALAMVSFSVSAQAYLEDPRYGNSPEERQSNVLTLNFFTDSYNSKDYDQALVYMKELVEKAPKASQNIYINGANIYKNKIARSRSVQDRSSYVDSLMMVYDLRAEHFGDDAKRGKAYVLGLKARDFLTFKGHDMDGVRKYFVEAIEAAGDNVDSDLVTIYFKALADGYKDTLVEMDELMSEYDRVSKYFEGDEDGRKTIDGIFVASGAANCENLEQVFGERLAANPDDDATIERAFNAMSRAECTSDLYFGVAEKYYEIKPSSDVATALARLFEEKKEYGKALKYLNEAAANEEDMAKKSNLYVRAAGAEIGARNSRSAAEYARKALEINPENGYAQMLLVQAYVMGSSGCSGFDRQSVYWLAYDMLSQARVLLADDEASIKSIETQMATYRANFPSKEECFFRGLNNGQGYTVSCGWVSGRTTVRQGQ